MRPVSSSLLGMPYKLSFLEWQHALLLGNLEAGVAKNEGRSCGGLHSRDITKGEGAAP